MQTQGVSQNFRQHVGVDIGARRTLALPILAMGRMRPTHVLVNVLRQKIGMRARACWFNVQARLRARLRCGNDQPGPGGLDVIVLGTGVVFMMRTQGERCGADAIGLVYGHLYVPAF